MQEVTVQKPADQKLGMVIKGGLQGQPGNPHDPTDEGVFISKINEGGCIHRDYSDRLKVRYCIHHNNGSCVPCIKPDRTSIISPQLYPNLF